MAILQGKKEIVVGSKVSQAEFDALTEVCQKEDRSMSYVLANLAIRGLALYKQDGILKLTEQEEKLFNVLSNNKKPVIDINVSDVNVRNQKMTENLPPEQTQKKTYRKRAK